MNVSQSPNPMLAHPVSSDAVSRRDFLLRAGVGAAGLAAAGGLARSVHAMAMAPKGWTQNLAPTLDEMLEVDLLAAPGTAYIRPGKPTAVWKYTGSVRNGPGWAVQAIPNCHLGPIIRVWTGQEMLVRLQNLLPEPHVTHWHGLDVPAAADGHPDSAVTTGDTRLYQFPVVNRAGTYWFHPHTDMRTVAQVYNGMAGLFIVSDAIEQSLPLPRGEFDIPLVIQDVAFDANNQWLYNPDPFNGFIGTNVMVNGALNVNLPVATRVYRFRVVNGCLSRIVKLQWSDGTPMVVIGNDGGLLGAPLTLPYVMLGPGERLELWADFRAKTLGSQITLRSLAFGGGGTRQGLATDLLKVTVKRPELETLTLPESLIPITPYQLSNAINAASPRDFPISKPATQSIFQLNGGSFDLLTVAANEYVPRNQLEVVRISNPVATPHVAHPIHFHGRQFQVLDRTFTGTGTALTNYNSARYGFVDAGWKDTFLIWPGETVRILMKWPAYTGKFLYHCHNLVHEDMGMMRNYMVV